MSDTPRSTYSARSRAPLNEEGIKWWDQYGNDEPTEYYTQNEADTKNTAFEHKSTSTGAEALQENYTKKVSFTKDSTEKVLEDLEKVVSTLEDNLEKVDPTEIVLKKRKEIQSKARFEQARTNLINSLKLKFEQTKTYPMLYTKRVDSKNLMISKDNSEGTSTATQGNFDFVSAGSKVGNIHIEVMVRSES
ncbi:hypothetical protein O0L34_g17422 [Tuta absoluta]|nr:hypothetical protein O0L34_g17422 [Tuta absoluta]